MKEFAALFLINIAAFAISILAFCLCMTPAFLVGLYIKSGWAFAISVAFGFLAMLAISTAVEFRTKRMTDRG